MAKIAASSGEMNQVATILESTPRSVGEPVKRFQPTIAPTIACEVATGILARVIQAMVSPAASATVKEPAMALTAPR